MAKLIYSAITSLDGYVEDENGKFDWSVPDAEVHAFGNDLERPDRHVPLRPPHVRDDGLWETDDRRAVPEPSATTRGSGGTPTRSSTPRRSSRVEGAHPIEREFDPEAVRRMKEAPAAT